MTSMADYYRQTWWLWLVFVIVFGLLGHFVVALFYLFIPGLLIYSAYFGMVRVSEFRNIEDAERRAAAPRRPTSQP